MHILSNLPVIFSYASQVTLHLVLPKKLIHFIKSQTILLVSIGFHPETPQAIELLLEKLALIPIVGNKEEN